VEKATEDTMFTYLEGLRQSGVTNMFGAAPYLEREFGLDRNEAKKVLMDWMKSYERVS
tara:strand:+ start:74 stop:247 length:174 start_codon:yes stop_codon:yes gene_type:complete